MLQYVGRLLWVNRMHQNEYLCTTSITSKWALTGQKHGWCHGNSKKLWLFYKNKLKIAFVSLWCYKNIHDAISTRKIPEKTRLHLKFSLGFFSGWNDLITVSITAETLELLSICLMYLSSYPDSVKRWLPDSKISENSWAKLWGCCSRNLKFSDILWGFGNVLWWEIRTRLVNKSVRN